MPRARKPQSPDGTGNNYPNRTDLGAGGGGAGPRRKHQSPAARMGSSGVRAAKTIPSPPQTAGSSIGKPPVGQEQLPNPQAPPGGPGNGTLSIPNVNHPTVVPLHAPTQRPFEPVTAGLPIGGPSGNVHGLVLDQATVADTLRGVGSAHPNDDILGLIQQLGPSGRR